MEKTMITGFWLLFLCGLTLAGYAQPMKDSAMAFKMKFNIFIELYISI